MTGHHHLPQRILISLARRLINKISSIGIHDTIHHNVFKPLEIVLPELHRIFKSSTVFTDQIIKVGALFLRRAAWYSR